MNPVLLGAIVALVIWAVLAWDARHHTRGWDRDDEL